jgi:hypothetical protein
MISSEKYLRKWIKDNSDNIDFFLEVLPKNGEYLQFASDRLRNNEVLVMKAVEQNGFSLKYASQSIRSNKQFMLKVISKLDNDLIPIWVSYVDESLRNDEEFMEKMLKKNGMCLEFASEKIKGNLRLVKLAMTYSILALKHANYNLQSNVDLLEMIEKNLNLLSMSEKNESSDWLKEKIQVLSKCREENILLKIMEEKTIENLGVFKF